jgi:CRP-like cAMP-binding protein
VQRTRGKRLFANSRTTGLWNGTAQLLSTLTGVASERVHELMSAAVMIELPPRAVIYSPGDACAGLYVIVSGKVKLSSPGSGYKPRVVAILEAGAWFGETALLLRERHAIGAQTAERAVLARIASATVIRLLQKDPIFTLRMLTETARRLRASMLEATETAAPARRRVIGFLLGELASSKPQKGAATITLPAVKRVVASRVGTSAETLSRVFRELSHEKLIAIDGPTVHVRDVGKLRAAYSR